MILKKQGLVSAYSGLQYCFWSHAPAASTSTSPSVLPIPRARPSTSNQKRRKLGQSQWRSYATVKDSKTYDFRDNMNWPCHKSQKKSPAEPTPYDIFEIERTETYSKQKFYELVKIYHPDRQTHHRPEASIQQIPTVERLERYRLIVQAHTILSDPARRKAYDATGAGWGTQSSWARADGNTRPHTASDHDSPFANATWEDWERWYGRSHSKYGTGPQTYAGTYVNPNAFASFVILMAIISGVLQATHAGQYSGSVEEKAKAFTAQTHQFMSDRKVENTEYSTSGFSGHSFNESSGIGSGMADHRIRHFLERRDPSKYGLKDEEEGTYRKTLWSEWATDASSTESYAQGSPD